MKNIRTFIKNELEARELSINQVAKSLKMDRKNLSDFLNNKVEMRLIKFIRLAAFLCNNDEIKATKLVEQYIKELKQKHNIRTALEYCSAKRLFDLGYELIKKNRELGDLNAEFANVYELVFLFQENKVSAHQLLLHLSSIAAKSIEMICLKRILVAYSMYAADNKEFMYYTAQGLEDEIKKIKNDYLRERFIIRISEVFGSVLLRVFNNPETARKYNQIIIDSPYSGESLKASAYYALGRTYLFESYEQSKMHFKTSIELYRKIGRIEMADELEEQAFTALNIIHQKNLDISRVKRPDLLAWYYISIGDKAIGKVYLKKALSENEYSKGLLLYLEGLVNNDISLMYDSLGFFIANGEIFYANLPRLELLRRGEPSYAIDAVYKYKSRQFEGIDAFEGFNYSTITNIRTYRAAL